MKKNYNSYLFVFALFLILSGCKTLKDGLQGNKRSDGAQEFLIDKKNPLVLPPDYKSLPVPEIVKTKKVNGEFNINKIIDKPSNKESKKVKIKDNSLEESIIKIIKQD